MHTIKMLIKGEKDYRGYVCDNHQWLPAVKYCDYAVHYYCSDCLIEYGKLGVLN